MRLFHAIRQRRAARRHGIHLEVERLEDRCLLDAGLTNVGEAILAKAQTQSGLYTALVDPTTGFGYFSPSHATNVIKVNLNGAVPEQVSDATPNGIPTGLGGMMAGGIDTSSADPSQHFIYFGAKNGTVLKLAPGDATHGPQVVATIQLSGLSYGESVLSAAIDTASADPTQHYVYFTATSNSGAGQVFRVRLSDFSQQGEENFTAPSLIRYTAIDPVRHFLYFESSVAASPYLVKLDISSFPNGAYSLLDLSSTAPGQGIARPGYPVPTIQAPPVVDVADNLIYIGTSTYDPSPGQPNINTWPYNQSLVAQINPGTGVQFPANPVVGILNLQPGERDLASVGFDQADGDLIYGSDNTYPAMVIRVHVGDGSQPMQELGSIRLQFGNLTPVPQDGTSPTQSTSVSTYGESFLLSGFFDGPQHAAFFGTDTGPGQVIEISVSPAGPPAPSAPPPPTALALAPGSDSGASASDDITNVTTPTVMGQAQAGATVALFDGATLLGTTTANAAGTWTLAVGPLVQGVHDLTATAANNVGTSPASAALIVAIDTTPPAAPVFDLDPSSDTAPVGDHATTLSTVTLTGQTDPGATVALLQTGAVVAANASGTFHFTNVSLTVGANPFTFQAADLAGNTSTFAQIVTELPAPPPAPPPPPPPPPPPQDHKIVFTSSRSGNYDIFTMLADGTQVTDLTNNPATDTMSAFTRDGTKIAFTSNRAGNYDIYTMNPDGSGVKQLTSNAGSMNFDPVFSNDDSKIAFDSNRSGGTQVYVMNADGTGLLQVTNFAGSNSMPSFNQDGTRLIFTSNMADPSGANGQLYSISVNGTGLTRLTNDSASDFFARYSPDGSHIVFESSRTGPNQIFTMNSDGSNQTQLTFDPTGGMMPSYSPDGSQICFVSMRDGNQEIYIMNADGSGATRLTNNPARDNYPSWDDVPRAYREQSGSQEPNVSSFALVVGNVTPATTDDRQNPPSRQEESMLSAPAIALSLGAAATDPFANTGGELSDLLDAILASANEKHDVQHLDAVFISIE